MSDSLLLRPAEAANLLGVSRSTMYELMDSRTVPYVVIPGMSDRRILFEDLEQLVAGLRHDAGDDEEGD